ncbi:MAG: DUF4340 domain-containing protein [Elusimicrobia bacterium]|nr:DUF4340 domain-containing protein [Elusimicrobiota bacterium]MDE2313432.1 DUF4340 domain-containing protein [Elusimicrobiota bacterium]
MFKRLGVLAAILIALCLAIFYFFAHAWAPRGKVPLAEIGETVDAIDISGPSGPIALRKTAGAWTMTAPVQDRADSEACRELIKSLSGLAVGDAVAENPASYPEYDIQEASATRVSLSAGSPPKKIFDAYFGKTAIGFNSIYLRWPDKKPVYLAEGLSRYMATKTASDYRDREVFSVPQDSAAAITVNLGRRVYAVEKSSSGWIFKSPKRAAQEASNLVDDLYSLRIAGFPPATEPAARMGFSRPLLSVEVSGAGEKEALVVGRPVKPTMKKQPPAYDYAKASGRASPFYLNVYDVNALLHRLVPPARTAAKKPRG